MAQKKVLDSFENQYFNLINEILENGTVCISGRQSQGEQVTRTKRIWGYTFEIDLEQEYPLLYSKHVAVKAAIQEILWIMQKQSNNIKDLKPHIWDKWADEDGSIRDTYGAQMRRPFNHPLGRFENQVAGVLGILEKDHSTRHAVLTMWNPETLDDNNCPACCYTSHYTIMDGKLNIAVIQRSADSIIGLPFNIAQYAFLAKAFARHLGVKPGKYVHVITDAHIYEDQYGNFDTGEMNPGFAKLMENHEKYADSRMRHDFEQGNMSPDVVFDESSTSFWDITDDNFKVVGYKAGEDCCEDISFNVTK